MQNAANKKSSSSLLLWTRTCSSVHTQVAFFVADRARCVNELFVINSAAAINNHRRAQQAAAHKPPRRASAWWISSSAAELGVEELPVAVDLVSTLRLSVGCSHAFPEEKGALQGQNLCQRPA